jgi:hypothetical protein
VTFSSKLKVTPALRPTDSTSSRKGMPTLKTNPSQMSEGRTDNLRMKQVEYWRWRYRDLKTGRMCRTMFQLTAEEASRYPDAERIDGTMLLREVDEDEVTEPAVFTSDARTRSPDATG